MERWYGLLDQVDHIVVTCSSCGFALMKDWQYLMDGVHDAKRIGAKTVHISRLLNQHRQRLKIGTLDVKLAYHHPCHLRIQPHSESSMDLLAGIEGVELLDLKSHCCGMAGSWGLIAENYELSKTIGTPMTEKLNASGARYGVTDCPTCQMQMAHLGSLPVRHPIEVVWEGLAHENIKY